MNQVLEEKVCASIATEKHIEIYNAINDLQDIQKHANQLLNRITGSAKVEAPPAANDIKQPRQSLLNMLNESPSEIQKVCSETHKILEEITQILF